MKLYRVLFALALVTAGCNLSNDDDITVIHEQFGADTHGWTGGFADYPAGQENFYNLRSQRTHLPEPLDTTQYALQIGGDNRSDDLFMFIKHRVRGLTPNKTYWINFKVEVASNAPAGSVGIGGSPGSSVFLKAGATAVEPKPVIVEEGQTEHGNYRMNIDKGNQMEDGSDMKLIGHVGHTGSEFEYRLIERQNTEPFEATASEDGILWLIIGTDSGFEGTTVLYYNKIEVVIY
jgi:hypothetical protein